MSQKEDEERKKLTKFALETTFLPKQNQPQKTSRITRYKPKERR